MGQILLEQFWLNRNEGRFSSYKLVACYSSLARGDSVDFNRCDDVTRTSVLAVKVRPRCRPRNQKGIAEQSGID